MYDSPCLPSVPPFHLGKLTIDLQRRMVIIDQDNVTLTTKEFDLLYFLARYHDWALTKEQIYDAVWNEDAVGSYHAVENAVYRIRQKTCKIHPSVFRIETVVGYGYRLKLCDPL